MRLAVRFFVVLWKAKIMKLRLIVFSVTTLLLLWFFIPEILKISAGLRSGWDSVISILLVVSVVAFSFCVSLVVEKFFRNFGRGGQ